MIEHDIKKLDQRIVNEMMNKIKVGSTDGLPELCYTVNDVSQELIIVKRGEGGYYPTDWEIKGESARVIAAKKNIAMGVTPEQAYVMETASMFWW